MDNYTSTYDSDTKIGDTIQIVNPRKPYLKDGEIYKVVGHTKLMKYPYVLINGERRYVGSGEFKIV